ncbi:MAG: hypothetical protein Q9203_006832 [Teloschistes exilis]
MASATYMCPVSPGSNDVPAIMYGFALQNLLSSYYDSVPVNESFYSTLPSPTIPMTDFLANTEGLAVQARLGEQGLLEAGMAAGAMKPNCNFSYPPVTDAKSHLMNAYDLEATMCGAFIGLADYVQSPQAAFLMARLAAEHGIHASYIGSHMKPVVFPTNSTSLTPAFKPEMVSMTGMGVGPLGDYLNNCVAPPAAPCGGTVEVGMTGAMLNGQGSANVMGNSSSAMGTGGVSSPSAMPQAFTGGAGLLQARVLVPVVLAALTTLVVSL